MLVAMLIGIPLGILVTRLRWLEGPVIGTTGVLVYRPEPGALRDPDPVHRAWAARP